MLEGEWWVRDCLYRDILYDDVFSGGLDAFVHMGRGYWGVWYGDHRLFWGVGKGAIIYKVWVVNVRVGSGWWASGGHDGLDELFWGSEEFGSLFIFLEEFRCISEISLVLP